MKVDIISSERELFSDEVELVMVPGVEGYLGILPHHAALVTEIKPGSITVRKDGQDTSFEVSSGFVEVTGNTVTVLADE
tara:strand:- start:1296 stop:1532 length:237 start_codon:yes stop_codon:yes gene_type:complete